MANKSKVEFAKLLMLYTSFTAKDGSQVKGKSSLEHISEKAIPVIYGKIKEVYDEWKKDKKEVEKKEEEDIEKGFEKQEKLI